MFAVVISGVLGLVTIVASVMGIVFMTWFCCTQKKKKKAAKAAAGKDSDGKSKA